MFDFFVNFGGRFFCCRPGFGTIFRPNTCIRRLFECNSLEWKQIHRKIKNGDTDLASPDVSNENNKRKILKDPLANYRSRVWKYVRFKIVNINETETVDKDKTVSYM